MFPMRVFACRKCLPIAFCFPKIILGRLLIINEYLFEILFRVT